MTKNSLPLVPLALLRVHSQVVSPDVLGGVQKDSGLIVQTARLQGF